MKKLNNKSDIAKFATSKHIPAQILTIKPKFILGSAMFNTPLLGNGMLEIRRPKLKFARSEIKYISYQSSELAQTFR